MFIQNKYELIEKIGNGSFSNVYKAKHYMKDNYVAIKFDHDEQSKILIQNEINIYLSLLKKGTISFVNIKSFGIIDKRNYIIMDYISCNLAEYISKNRETCRTIDPVGLLKQIIGVVKKLHDCGYVHRDLKPDNLLVRENEIYLIDLGFSTKLSDKVYDKMIGSVLFASYNTHASKYQYRKKDDIISCFYIVLHLFCKKTLPWSNIVINGENDNTKEMLYHLKKYTDFGRYYKDNIIERILEYLKIYNICKSGTS